MRRFSFNIDLTNKDKSKDSKPKPKASPENFDGYQMSHTLAEQRQHLKAWPQFQRHLDQLPVIFRTTEAWEDLNLAAEFVRIFNVSKEKVTDAAPGFSEVGKTETHCFFTPDGSKHLVSRLLSSPQERINEIRLSPDGQLVRLYYENTTGRQQNLDDLFEAGLSDLDLDVGRFARFPNYVLRFLILRTQADTLESSFRGVCYYDHEVGTVVTQEAATL